MLLQISAQATRTFRVAFIDAGDSSARVAPAPPPAKMLAQGFV